jgi:hypothetical protein
MRQILSSITHLTVSTYLTTDGLYSQPGFIIVATGGGERCLSMFTLLRGRSFKSFSIDTAPPLLAAFIVAEIFYKWHSFTLECLGFLATWFVFDLVWVNLVQLMRPTKTL